MRTLAAIALASTIAACGDEHGRSIADAPPPVIPDAILLPPDAAEGPNPGFSTPSAAMRANVEQGPDNWVEIGPADFSCLNTPSGDQPTTTDVSLATSVRDFQSRNALPGASISAIPGGTTSGVSFPGSPHSADANGDVTIAIPAGTVRYRFEVAASGQMLTRVFNEIAAPSPANQTRPPVESFSNTTAQVLPALIGISRTPNTAIVLSRMVDCQGRAVSNFVATVSVMPGSPVHITGAQTFYFSPEVGLPVRNSQRASGARDGRFMVIEIPGTPEAFIQVWGFPTDADLAVNNLVLVAELTAPLPGEMVATGALVPFRI